MGRRKFLASCSSIGLIATSGCVSQVDDILAGRRAPTDFETCTRLIIRIDQLPRPARVEAETILQEGFYETTEEPYLPNLIGEDSYLAVDSPHQRRDYKLVEDRDAGTTILRFEQERASWGSSSLVIENDTQETVEAEILVTRAGDGAVVEETLTIRPESEERTAEYDRKITSYSVSIQTREHDQEFEVTESEGSTPVLGYVISEEEIEEIPRPVLDVESCRRVWD